VLNLKATGEAAMRDIGALMQAALQWLMSIVGALLAALSLIAIVFTGVLVRAAHKRGELKPNVEAIGLGIRLEFNARVHG